MLNTVLKMYFNATNKLAILHFLSLSSEDDDDDVIELIFNRLFNINPKINSYIIDVLHNYSNKQISS